MRQGGSDSTRGALDPDQVSRPNISEESSEQRSSRFTSLRGQDPSRVPYDSKACRSASAP